MHLAAASADYSPELLHQIRWFVFIFSALVPLGVPAFMGFFIGAVRFDLFCGVAIQFGVIGWSLTEVYHRLKARSVPGGIIFLCLCSVYVFLCLVTNFFLVTVLSPKPFRF